MKKTYAATLILLLAGCEKSPEQKLVCHSIWKNSNSSGVFANASTDDVAVHLLGNTITLSGNEVFSDVQNLPFCTTSQSEVSKADQPYFDTQGCTGKSDPQKERTYGSYNRILRKLEVSFTLPQQDSPVRGEYICETSK